MRTSIRYRTCEAQYLVLVLVLFPADIADRTRPPTWSPMSYVRNGVLGAAAKAFGFWRRLQILHFTFWHSDYSSYLISAQP